MPTATTEVLVLDASAAVELLIGSATGRLVRQRVRGCGLHAPAHVDAEILSALGRMHRAGTLAAETVEAALMALRDAPITRHPLAGLLAGAWRQRKRHRLVDGLYLELSGQLSARLLTTDARLARSARRAELIAARR